MEGSMENAFAVTQQLIRRDKDVADTLISLANTAAKRQGMVFCDMSDHIAIPIAEEVIGSAGQPESGTVASPFADEAIDKCREMIAGIVGDIDPIPADVCQVPIQLDISVHSFSCNIYCSLNCFGDIFSLV